MKRGKKCNKNDVCSVLRHERGKLLDDKAGIKGKRGQKPPNVERHEKSSTFEIRFFSSFSFISIHHAYKMKPLTTHKVEDEKRTKL